MTQVVYVDVLLAINFVVNYFLLLGTFHLARQPVVRLRLFWGALLGAGFSLGIFLPQESVLGMGLFRFVAAAAMVFVAFPFGGWRKFCKELLIFFCSSFLFAGAMLGLWMAFSPRGMIYNSGVVYLDIRPVTLILFTGAAYLLLTVFQRIFHREQAAGERLAATLRRGENRLVLPALFDTGNHLREPFSGLPVALCSLSDVLSLLTVEEMEAIQKGEGYPPSLRLIPYRDATGPGLLPAVRLDGMELLREGRHIPAGECFLAISNAPVGGEGYRLVLPLEVSHVLQ